MKTCFYLLLLLVAFSTCNKDKKETPQPETPKRTSKLTYAPIYNKDYPLATMRL